MCSLLKYHPFAVEAFFDSSAVLTFAIPKEELQHMIPDCLTLDTFNDKWAFIAVATVQTRKLRPRGVPEILGNDFFLIGYRIFVRYINSAGKRLRGLYILKSETDKKKMEFLGNMFTKYRYATIDIRRTEENGKISISSARSGLELKFELGDEDIDLPQGSPFSNWKEARRFAGPLPFTFSYDKAKNRVLIVEGVRGHWQPAPLNVIGYKVPFLDSLELKGIHLASGFIVNDIPYCWKKGKLEKWPH